ncbi:MAG: DNA primase [bacterium]
MTDVQTIKDKLDIVQIISEYIQLKKAGINYKACCPFHHEKTPSFMVNAERQFFHCFGCSKSGDVFTFLQEMEGLDFPEALKLLADRAGVKIESYRSEINKSQKNRIKEINEKAAFFFHKFLTEMPTGVKARSYLSNRKISDQTIVDWQIGFVPDQWDLLIQYLLKKGFGIDDLTASGLIIKRENADVASGRGYYDRFRGRIMFPIQDIHDNVVGFTGRILVEGENTGGKYINTPQTPVFDKSRLLYGLNKARMEIKKKDFSVLVEGQLDVISCHVIGMKNVVASSGTALTLEQIKMLKRYSSNIAMAFDSDSAGIRAAKRGIDIAIEQGMNVKIIQIPEGRGKDADECIKKDKNEWSKAVANAKQAMQWYFEINLNKLDLSDLQAKRKAEQSILMEIARLPYAIEREHWLANLSDKIGIHIDALREDLKKIIKQDNQTLKYSRKGSSGATTGDTQQGADGKIEDHEETKPDRYISDLKNLLCLLLSYPMSAKKVILEVKKDFFLDQDLLAIYENLKEQYNNKQELDAEAIAKFIPDRLKDKAGILLLRAEKYYGELSERDIDRELESVLSRVEGEYRKRKITGQIGMD